jgi:hypothetical protein
MSLADMKKPTKERMKEAFGEWIADPAVRMCMSLIPSPAEHGETLEMLLRSAYEAGFKNGGGSMAADMLGSIMKADASRRGGAGGFRP